MRRLNHSGIECLNIFATYLEGRLYADMLTEQYNLFHVGIIPFIFDTFTTASIVSFFQLGCNFNKWWNHLGLMWSTEQTTWLYVIQNQFWFFNSWREWFPYWRLWFSRGIFKAYNTVPNAYRTCVFNRMISIQRLTIEHVFGDITNLFQTISSPRRLDYYHLQSHIFYVFLFEKIVIEVIIL